MTCFDILQKLREDGELNLLFRMGIIGYKPMFYLDIVQHYDILKKKGYSNRDALYECAYKFGTPDKPLCNMTVYRALKAMGYAKNRSADSN